MYDSRSRLRTDGIRRLTVASVKHMMLTMRAPMTHRGWGQRKNPARWGAAFCAFAFLTASHYCALEAFAAAPAHHEDSSHAEGHGHGAGLPANGDDGELCCIALQAILLPKSDLSFARSDAPVFQLPALETQWPELPAHLPRAASGLSPPIRDPVPSAPFYRTTYASHAPPVCLA